MVKLDGGFDLATTADTASMPTPKKRGPRVPSTRLTGRRSSPRAAAGCRHWHYGAGAAGVGDVLELAPQHTTSSAEPTNPNQNGAVIPNARASRPPSGVPMTSPPTMATR